MKTIKQLADEIGVSKTAIRKKIANLELSDKLRTKGNQFLIDSKQESLIKSTFTKIKSETENQKLVSDETENFQLVSDMISILKEQLEVKDKQIVDLSERLSECSNALMTAQQTAQTAQALHAGTLQQNLALDLDEIKEPEKKWWKFWQNNRIHSVE